MMNRMIKWLSTLSKSHQLKQLLVTGRAFSLLSFSSMLFFVVLGIAVMVHAHAVKSPLHSMSGLAASVSSGLFGDMLEMEMPAFQSGLPSESISGKDVSVFLMRTLTDVNPNNPKTLLAGELPGFGVEDSFLIRKGVGTNIDEGPKDHNPIYDPLEGLEESEGVAIVPETTKVPMETESPVELEVKEPVEGKPTTGQDKVVFIYHSHNRESWYPELDNDVKDPSSTTTNITLVGKRLAEKLEEAGVGALVSEDDYPTAIKDYRWELSYKYSKSSVIEAMENHTSLKFFFDLHRDSQKRKYTTVDINGKSYAQVYFIIGHKNPNWEENEAFATQIHDALEKKYPGISRGIWGKTAATGNGEYNQSLAPDSLLVEIGGVDNTLDESYRTADALAEVVSSIYWDAMKVSGEEG